MERILISACLLGHPVRYDGSAKPVADPRLQTWLAEGRLVAACPESLGGLPTPRAPAEIQPGKHLRVVDATGRDQTSAFELGARAALQLALDHGCTIALLKDGSPSCGSTYVLDGTFSGTRRTARGATAALLVEHGITVFSEHDIDGLAARLSA